jgi:uncharacterized membrane protein YdjX (TVP38/TMEM64 family)
MFGRLKPGRNLGRKLLAAILFCGVGAFLAFSVDFHAARQWVEGVDGGWFFLLLAVLPILGFPLSVLQIIVGVKFGFWAGMSLTAAAMSVHLLGAHWVGSGFLKEPAARLLSRTRFRLPQVHGNEQSVLGFLVPLLPGSYTVKNYLMVLGGVSLRTLLCICLPVYAVRASSGIFLGDISGNLTPWLIALLVVGKIVAIVITIWVIKRYRHRFVHCPTT